MPSVTIHPLSSDRLESCSHVPNPLPHVLQTPAGLAILEIQGTIHMPDATVGSHSNDSNEGRTTPIGRLVFPDYVRDDPTDSKAWMKRVHLYVGRHQRLTGYVKKLANPMAILRRKTELHPTAAGGELEIAEIIYYKILFSSRPEPVSS